MFRSITRDHKPPAATEIILDVEGILGRSSSPENMLLPVLPKKSARIAGAYLLSRSH